MEFKDFLEKQNSIYSRMESSSLEETGVVPNIPKYQGSYLIVFRHPDKIVESATNVSYKVSEIIPSIIYDKSNLHTTILVEGTSDDFSLDKGVLEELSKSVDSSVKGLRRPTINYDSWLYNKNSLIAKGNPDENFFNTMQEIGKNSKQRGLETTLAWGAHMTVNRFTEERNPNNISDIIKVINEMPALGESKPFIVDVGHFIFTPKGFDYYSYEQFKIK
ncbi:MAG: hypothetical protein ABIE36_00400 [Candidatus Diapherotrites archaeon]